MTDRFIRNNPPNSIRIEGTMNFEKAKPTTLPHTSGEWSASMYDRTLRSVDNLRDPTAKPFVIARFPMRTNNYPISHEEWLGNSLLIENAPNLLAVCQETLNTIMDILEAQKTDYIKLAAQGVRLHNAIQRATTLGF